jgi:malonate transporter and related proteins
VEAVLSSLVPVVLLIAVGYLAAQRRWVGPGSVRDLSTLVFIALTPALMFRTLAKVDLLHLNLLPLAGYFTAVVALFLVVVAWGRATRRAAAMAISACFGNTVAIGIPIVTLAYGEAALLTLLTIIAVHALILLTLTTVVFELAVLRERAVGADASPGDDPSGGPGLWRQVLTAIRSGLFNPSTTPALLGLAFAQSGWTLPLAVDRTLQLLAAGMAPMALLVVGASLASTRVGQEWRPALRITMLKNLVLPLLVGASAWAWGLRGTPLVVCVVAASMPVGANAFMFAQRYNVAQSTVTAAVALSTLSAVVTASAAMALMSAWGW